MKACALKSNIPECLRRRHGVVAAVHNGGDLGQDDLLDDEGHEPAVGVRGETVLGLGGEVAKC